MAGLPRWPSGLRQRTSNPCYAGSNPARGAKNFWPNRRPTYRAIAGTVRPNMDNQGDGWRHSVKDRLKPLRDRLVHVLGGTLPERGVSYEELVHLLYPTLPEALRIQVDQAGAGDLTRVSTIRRMLGTIEHQVAPTAFSVQLAEEDAVRCTVGGVELFCDAADAAVTPGLRSGVYEPHLSAVFERYCTAGMTVVDVGANLGYYSLLASQSVGPSGNVIALEPNSRIVASCCLRCGWAGSPTCS